ncbi:MAG: hypothetical protein ACI85K_001298 [Hyphomicrobiaceae bacterium]|jgi:hypothetical protein
MAVIPPPMSDTQLQPTSRSAHATAACESERGVALVMALIFSILLYILVAELVVSSRMVRATGENDALLARMRTQMQYQLLEAEEKLLADLVGQAEDMGGEGGGGLGALAGAAAASGGAEGGEMSGEGEGEGEEEEDPTSKCDSSRDSWFEPVGHPDNDLTTYVWIEDENRKLNLLTLWSPDEDFAQVSRDRMVRLIDGLREDTEFDVSSGDATMIVQSIIEWGSRPNTEQMPTPELKTDSEMRREFHIPLHLDELMMLPQVTPELFFDKVLDKRHFPGLESVLTLWTATIADPGDPEKLARQRAARGEPAEEPAAEPGAGEQPGGEGVGEEPSQQPEGLGIRINVNTASRAVLRALFDPIRVPDRVIDGIIRYRNEIDEEASDEASDENASESADFGDMQLGNQPLYNFFEEVADLEEVEEFAQISDEEVKSEITTALTTKSEVFSIHMASLFKRNEDENNRVYLVRRARSIVMRLEEGDEGKIVPLVPFEERIGLRVKPVEMQDDYALDFTEQYMDMDQFAQDERAWNPFLIDFYMPKDVREEFVNNR